MRTRTIVATIKRKDPLRLMLFSLLFIYGVQYPVSLLLSDEAEARFDFSFSLLVLSYFFVVLSSLVLFIFFYFGTSVPKKTVVQYTFMQLRTEKRSNMSRSIVIFIIFFLWSYLMLKLKIGMTIYADFQPLPFRLTGLLFYGRLLVQPLVLFHIAMSFVNSKRRKVILLLMILLGFFVAFSSGSRFVSILFAIPVLPLLDKKYKYILLGCVLFIFIQTASLTRHFFLPFVIGGDYIEIYGNDLYKESLMKDVLTLPLRYVINRSMGISEVMLTLSYKGPTSLFGGLASVAYYYLPIGNDVSAVSAKAVYGLDEDEFGGFGLDIYSNYWLIFGRSYISYFLGLVIASFLLGRVYAYGSIFFEKINFVSGNILFFLFLFFLFFEGRAFLLLYLLVITYCLFKLKFDFKFLNRSNLHLYEKECP